MVFFLKQWCMYGMHALQLVLWWWWCLNVHGIVAVHVWCAWWWLQAVAVCGVCTWYSGCMVWRWTHLVAVAMVVVVSIYTYTMSCILMVHHYLCVCNYIIRPLSFHLEQSMCHLHKGDLTFLNYTLHTFLSWHICSIYYSYLILAQYINFIISQSFQSIFNHFSRTYNPSYIYSSHPLNETFLNTFITAVYILWKSTSVQS